jgi:hypothetical protein
MTTRFLARWPILAGCETWQAQADGLKRFRDEIATDLDALLPAPLDRAFKGEL